MQARYIVFDGDVDAVWVENMNSVMDDNKLLTLPNGERIRVQNHCKLLFEVFDLQYASPATISRCGMVYVDSRNLGYEPFIWTWLRSRSDEDEREQLRALFDKYATPCVNWVLQGVEGDQLVKRPVQTIPITNLNMIQQLTSLFDTLAGPSGSIDDAPVRICGLVVPSMCAALKSSRCASCRPITVHVLHRRHPQPSLSKRHAGHRGALLVLRRLVVRCSHS